MHIPNRPWSESTFLEILADQALLYRARRGDIDRGWPDKATRLAAIERDWYWMAGILPSFIEALLDEATRTQRPVSIHTSTFGGCEMTNIMYKVHAPFFADWFVNWVGMAATGALCFSPHFCEQQLLKYRGGTYRISRNQRGDPTFEKLEPALATSNRL